MEQGNSLVLLTLFTQVGAAPLASSVAVGPVATAAVAAPAAEASQDHSQLVRNIMHSTTAVNCSSLAIVVGVATVVRQSGLRSLTTKVAPAPQPASKQPRQSHTITATASYTMRNNLHRHCCSTKHIVSNTGRHSSLQHPLARQQLRSTGQCLSITIDRQQHLSFLQLDTGSQCFSGWCRRCRWLWVGLFTQLHIGENIRLRAPQTTDHSLSTLHFRIGHTQPSHLLLADPRTSATAHEALSLRASTAPTPGH